MNWQLNNIIRNLFKQQSDEANVKDDNHPFKRLIIMRHGHELDRELMVNQVTHSLHELNKACPDTQIHAILHSPLERTMNTAVELHKQVSAQRPMAEGEPEVPLEDAFWLSDNASKILQDREFGERVQRFDDTWDTVCLVTHATTSANIAKGVNTQASEMEIKYPTSDYASMLVLDIQAPSWKEAGNAEAHIALGISQKETLRPSEIQPAIQSFLNELNNS